MAMEAEDWLSAIAQLTVLAGQPLPARDDVAVRLLLAQSLHAHGQCGPGHAQATLAHQRAIEIGDRGLIWKSMALLASMDVLDHGRL